MLPFETTLSCCLDLPGCFNNFKSFLNNIKNANDPRCVNLYLLHSQRLLWHPNAGSSKTSLVTFSIYVREIRESDVQQCALFMSGKSEVIVSNFSVVPIFRWFWILAGRFVITQQAICHMGFVVYFLADFFTIPVFFSPLSFHGIYFVVVKLFDLQVLVTI